MRTLWKDLLFLHGHITHPRVLEPAAVRATTPAQAKVLSLPQTKSPAPAVRGEAGTALRDCA
jgi:hypothetical protein